MADTDIRRWAMKGAEQRLLEIAAEAAAIYKAFPELREQAEKRAADGKGSLRQPRRRRRFRMSADARKRIAEAQRKRWAEWKAQNGNSKSQRSTRLKRTRPRASPKSD